MNEEEFSREPIIVDHGNAFGTGNWYTFYCGYCKGQIFANQEECKCTCKAVWPKGGAK
jgi:hypothetical protein